MDSEDLEHWQIEAIQEQIRPTMVYLGKVKNRMFKRAFPKDDEIFQKTVAAYDALFSLRIALHYLSCKTGVARKSRRDQQKNDQGG